MGKKSDVPIDDVRFGEDFQENRIYLYFSWHLIWFFCTSTS